MNKVNLIYVVAILAGAFSFCSCADETEEITSGSYSGTSPGGTSSTTSSALVGSLSELVNLDISLNTTPLDEIENTVASDDEFYESYVETDFSEQYVVNVVYSGTSATVSGDVDAVTVSYGDNQSDVIIVSEEKGVHYVLSGSTTDGSFKIYSEKKFVLELNGVSITNPTGAAINNQGKRAFVVLTDGTNNYLSDGTTYADVVDGEDMKGTFFSEGKLAFSGSGSLSVSSKGKHGIVSDDYLLFRPGVNVSVNSTSGHCIKANDGIIVRGGVINCQTSAPASKGLTTDGMFHMQGGRVTAITTGNAQYDSDEQDVSGASGLKADSIIVMTGGELLCKSTGKGGKGISTDQSFTMTGGVVEVVTTGTTFTYSSKYDSKSKGIKADGNILIEGGSLKVRASGDSGSEGIETKGYYIQNGGQVGVVAYDDGVNSKYDMTINGGNLFGYGLKADGIDSNGDLIVNGGALVGCGTSAPEEGIDAAENHNFKINGGVVLGIGGGGEAMSGTQQKASISGVSVSGGSYLAVGAGGNWLFACQMPCNYSNATLQLSSPKFTASTTYTLYTASQDVVEGTDVFGLIISPEISKSSEYGNFSTSTSTTGGMSGNMGGGNPPHFY